MNLLQLVGAMKSKNSVQGLMSMVPNEIANNPMGQNVMTMFQNQDVTGLENFARNLCKEKGIDPNTAFSTVSSLFSK